MQLKSPLRLTLAMRANLVRGIARSATDLRSCVLVEFRKRKCRANLNVASTFASEKRSYAVSKNLMRRPGTEQTCAVADGSHICLLNLLRW